MSSLPKSWTLFEQFRKLRNMSGNFRKFAKFWSRWNRCEFRMLRPCLESYCNASNKTRAEACPYRCHRTLLVTNVDGDSQTQQQWASSSLLKSRRLWRCEHSAYVPHMRTPEFLSTTIKELCPLSLPSNLVIAILAMLRRFVCDRSWVAVGPRSAGLWGPEGSPTYLKLKTITLWMHRVFDHQVQKQNGFIWCLFGHDDRKPYELIWFFNLG